MAEFFLVDLYTQREAVAHYVKNWPAERILEWMKQYGTVTRIITEYDDKLYSFQSNSGEVTPFRIAEDGTLRVFHNW